jgi:hypothetical protein
VSAWTKADLRRMQAVLDRVAHDVTYRLRYDTPDEHRDGVNASIRTNARAIVRDGLLVDLPAISTRERKASERIATRLLTEDLPPEVVIPQVITHREVAESLRVQAEQEAARLAADEKARTPVAVVYQPDAERDRRTIAFNLRETIGRGVVEVHRATADAFGTDTQWGDVDGLVTWQAWARPAAERRGCWDAWDRCTFEPAKLRANAEPLARLWAFACDEETLPAVLDLRGIPAVFVDIPAEKWMKPLIAALRKASAGVVLVTDCEAWVLSRLLPARIGETC